MPKLKHVLVPTDLSAESSGAAKWAAEAAGDAKITVLFVPATLAEIYPHATTPVEILAVDARIRSKAQADLDRWVKRYLGSVKRVVTEIRSGEPAEQIVGAAADLGVDLIAMTTHAHAGWKHLVLGSVTAKVLRDARCPVAVTRPKKR